MAKKSTKKLAKKLTKKVVAGSITLDEMRARLGRHIAQKNSAMTATAKQSDPHGLKANAQHAITTHAVLSKSESVPYATRDIATAGGMLNKDLVNAIRTPITTLVEQIRSQTQPVNPYGEGYKAATPGVSKAYTGGVYKGESRTAFLNSPDPATRAVAEKLWKTPAESDADAYAKSFFHERQKLSDNPAEREAAFKREHPDKAPIQQHVMVSAADGILRDAGTGEPVKVGSKLPDPSPDLFGSDGRGITAGFLNDQLTYVDGGGYVPGYERTFGGLQ